MKTHLFVLLSSFALGATMAPAALAADDPGAQITRPTAYKPKTGDVALGEKLFNDTQLSTNGLACASCHAKHGGFQASFAKPYPHAVAMAREQLGRKSVYLDEMVQGCMVMPMAAKPLPWDSKELAGLTAYMLTVQKSFKPSR